MRSFQSRWSAPISQLVLCSGLRLGLAKPGKKRSLMVGARNPWPQAKRSLLPVSLMTRAAEARPVRVLPNWLLSSQRRPPPRKRRSKIEISFCPKKASVLRVSLNAVGKVPIVLLVPDSLRYSHPRVKVFHRGMVNVLSTSAWMREVLIVWMIVSVPGGGLSRKLELLNHCPKLAETFHQLVMGCVYLMS